MPFTKLNDYDKSKHWLLWSYLFLRALRRKEVIALVISDKSRKLVSCENHHAVFDMSNGCQFLLIILWSD